MPDPAALPVELFDIILQCLAQDYSTLPYLHKPETAWIMVADLHACSLVSRAWNVQSTPRLYSDFRCLGDRHSFAQLWHFLRTVVAKPALGAMVQHLDVRDCHQWHDPQPGLDAHAREQRLRRQELTALFDAGHRMGYEGYMLSNALRAEIRFPFMVVLIGCLPSLSTLYFSLDVTNEEDFDRLCQALREPGVLPELTSATYFKQPLVEETLQSSVYPCLWTYHVDETFLLPSIRELVLIDVHVCLPNVDRRPAALQVSPVTHLTIVPGNDARLMTRYEKQSLKVCLQLPRALVSLTLFLPRQMSRAAGLSPSHMIPNDQLWQILCVHKHSLEYLDLYDRDALYEQVTFQQKPHLGPLDDFDHLRTLRIQVGVLQGGVNGILKAPYRFRDALPGCLRALTLYSVQFLTPDLRAQLSEVIISPSFPALKFLIIQETDNDPYPRRVVSAQNPSFLELCKEHKVLLKLVNLRLLPMGGSNLLKYAMAYDPERYVSAVLGKDVIR
ncbi:hypothetical protein MMC09_003542 [Bachmanniomyces sp. S44760]|nr:hypothetical protein [Bachmanniomyces sp. S44760]